MSRVGACAALLLVAAVGGTATPGRTPAPPHTVTLYGPRTDHLWNRLHEALFVRLSADGTTYGSDRVDPLLWRETRHLLTGPSHDRAISLLDEFLASDGERMVAQPLRRAVFQHDLWAVFDWLAATSREEAPARVGLQQRLARVIRRVALSRAEIDVLPDSYAEATSIHTTLPRGLSDVDGRWVGIGGSAAVVPLHTFELGRSSFLVEWTLPRSVSEKARRGIELETRATTPK